MGTSHQEASDPDLRDLFGKKRLPVRVKPLEDELFSSWFVRSAQSNGLRVHQLEHSLVQRGRPLFAGDPDRGVWQSHARALAVAMDLSAEVAINTVLKSYEGYLWASVPDHGVWQNVMPIANGNRQRRLNGLQYCPQCLRTDKQPYFRKHWRLAFCVVCDLHACEMRDSCPQCGQPITLHRLNAGNKRFRDLKSLSSCCVCGGSLICETASLANEHDLVEFQKTLLMTLRRGWIVIDGRCVHSTLFFQGLRMLISLVEDTKRSAKLIKLLAAQLLADEARNNRYGGYEARSLRRRLEVLKVVNQLLLHGTEEMANKLALSGVRLQDIHRFHLDAKGSVPFWLWEPLHFHIDRSFYTPTDEEIQRAVQYVAMTYGTVTIKLVCATLNQKTRSNARVAKERRLWLLRSASLDGNA